MLVFFGNITVLVLHTRFWCDKTITISQDSDHGAAVSHTLHAELMLSRSMLYVSCITVVLVKKGQAAKRRKET